MFWKTARKAVRFTCQDTSRWTAAIHLLFSVQAVITPTYCLSKGSWFLTKWQIRNQLITQNTTTRPRPNVSSDTNQPKDPQESERQRICDIPPHLCRCVNMSLKYNEKSLQSFAEHLDQYREMMSFSRCDSFRLCSGACICGIKQFSVVQLRNKLISER